MFFVNVQSCSVLNAFYIWIRYSVIQSCFLLTMPPFSCRQIFMIFVHSHFHLCLSQHHYLIALHQPPAEMLQPGRCPSSHFTEDSGVLTSSFGLLCSPDSRTSLRLLARFTAASWLSFTIDYSTAYLRATHWPVRAIVDSQHRHHPHHRPSCILRAPHPSETYASSIVNIVIPLITSVGSSAPTSRSVASLQRLRAPSPRRAPLHAAHAFIQLRIIVCSWAPFSPLPLHRPRPTLVFHPPR